ncbi:MAG: serine/threonine-protein kinase, partial [Myxococcota bacterium]|nr:serine/threonine-protein kinase [Myxococcota bacterium]
MSRQDPPRGRVVTLKPKGPAGVPAEDVAETPPPLPTGTQLAGRYRLDTILGRGGMATVYMGLDQALGREVAIKVLEPELAAQAIVVKRFLREAQIMASLDSPRVVPIYDVGRDGPHVFLVMKCLPGVSLEDLIVQDGALPPERAAPLVAQVLEGLAVVHRRGLVHRDVKPGNVMVIDGDQAILLDLGIARDPASRGMTTEGTMLGTPEYMAPEQMLGRTVDHRTDLYAVGVLLFEALTGRLPFSGETPIEIGLRHVSDDPPSPRRFASWISEALAAAVLRAMAKDPAQRYQSANEMREALLAALAVAAPGPAGAEHHLPAPQPAGDAQAPTLLVAPGSFTAATLGPAAGVGPPLPKRRRALLAALAAGTVLAAAAALVIYFAARPGNELPAGRSPPMR